MTCYARWPRYVNQPKPEPGTAKMERQDSKAEVDSKIDKNIAAIKKLDGKCRLPFCPWCKAFKHMLQHGAHVLGAKGMGGDPSLEVSQPQHLMRLCALSHASQERHEWEVVPLTTVGTRGICEFYLLKDVYDPETSAYSSERILWAREKAIGQADSPLPYAAWDPISRLRPVD